MPTPLVTRTLETLFEENQRAHVADMVTPQSMRAWSKLPLHAATRAYFNPSEGLRSLADLMEGLAGMKELLFALGAGIYALWLWSRRRQRQIRQQELSRQKERLDDLLTQTVRIERAQMGSADRIELQDLLDDVTRIKLKALDELTHEELRTDRAFSIFLMQCSSLIRKIQSKISQRGSPR